MKEAIIQLLRNEDKAELKKILNDAFGPQVLSFRNKKLDIQDIRILAEVLKINTTVTSLDLKFVCLEDAGAEIISRLLKQNTSLSELNLSGNLIGNEGARAITEVLQKNTSLRILKLTGNVINLQETGVIIAALQKNTSLSKLNLGKNSMNNEGAKEIAKVLRVNTTLTSLNLNYMNLYNAEIPIISESLKRNTSLLRLNLRGNLMGLDRAQGIADFLSLNTTLTCLNMNCMVLDDIGVQIIAPSLKKNTSLLNLSLNGNCITKEGAKKITETLKLNTTLTSLDLAGNFIKNIDQNLSVKENKTLLELKAFEVGCDPTLSVRQTQLQDDLQENKTNIKNTANFIHIENLSNPGLVIDIDKKGYKKFFLYKRIRHIFCNHMLSGTSKFCEVFGTKEMITKKQCQLIDYIIEKNWFVMGGICKSLNEKSALFILPGDMIQQIGRYLKLADIKHKKHVKYRERL